MPGPYPTIEAAQAARASGELTQRQYIDALRAIRATPAVAPPAAAPATTPRATADIGSPPLPRAPDIEAAREKNVAEREERLRLNRPDLTPNERRQQAIEDYGRQYGVDPEPRTLGEAATRAFSRRTLQGLEEQEAEAQTAADIRARGVAEIQRLRASGADAAQVREAARRYEGMARQLEAQVVEGPIMRGLRVVGSAVANVPLEIVGRQAEFTQTKGLEPLVNVVLPGVPALVRQAVGARPSDPLTTAADRGRTRRTGSVLDIVHDYFQSVERGEGLMDLYQAIGRTQGVQPGTPTWAALSATGFAGDVLFPWEGVLGVVTKPARAAASAAKASRLAPVGAGAATALAAARAAFGIGDVVDIARVASRAIDDDLAAFRRPVLPDAIRADMEDLAARLPGRGMSLRKLEADIFDAKQGPLRQQYKALVEAAYRRQAIRQLGTEQLVRLTGRTLVTPHEARAAHYAVQRAFEAVGLPLKQTAQRIADAGRYVPTAEEGVALQKLSKRAGLPVSGPVREVTAESWTELVERSLERRVHPSARAAFSRANQDRLVQRLAENLLNLRGMKAPDPVWTGRLRRLKSMLDIGAHDAETRHASPEIASVLRIGARRMERVGEDLAQDAARVAGDARSGDEVRGMLSASISQSWHAPSAAEIDLAQSVRRLKPDQVTADQAAALADQVLATKRVEWSLVPYLTDTDPAVRLAAVQTWGARRRGDAQAFTRKLLAAFAPRVTSTNVSIGAEEALAIHRRVAANGIDAEVVRWLKDKSNVIEDEPVGLYNLAVQLRVDHIMAETVDEIAEIEGAIPGTGGYHSEVVEEVNRILRGADARDPDEVPLPFTVVPALGRDDTPYHRWWIRTSDTTPGSGIGRATVGERRIPVGDLADEVDTAALADAMGSGRPVLQPTVRAYEPGADIVLRQARALEDAGDVEAAAALLREFPGDVVSKKYAVWHYHGNAEVATGLTLDEAIKVMSERLDLHDGIEAMGSGRKVAGWAQPGRRVRDGMAPDGSSVDDYIGASETERLALDARWKGRYQIPNDSMATALRERAAVRERVVVTTPGIIRSRAAAFVERWGLATTEGGTRMVKGTVGDVVLPDGFVDFLNDAARRAGINDSNLWPSGSMPASVLSAAVRAYKSGLLWGLGIPNPAYYVGNAVSAPFIMALQLGPVGAGRALSQWVRHPRAAAALVRELSPRLFSPKLMHPSDAGGLVAKDGRVYSTATLVDEARRHGIDNSQARIETSRQLQRAIMDADERALSRVVTAAPDGLQGVVGRGTGAALRYARAWQGILEEAAHATDQFFRVSVFLNQLEDGVPPARAAAVAREALFDFGAMSNWERFVLRKVVLFYAWQRKSMDALVYQLATHPERIGGLARFARDQRRFVLDPREQLGEFDDNAVKIVAGVSDPPDMAPGVSDYRYSNMFWYSAGLPALDQLGMLNSIAGLAGPDKADAVLSIAQTTVLPLRSAVETAAGTTTFGSPLESGSVNDVPDWVVDLDDRAFGGNLQELFGIELVPARDARAASQGGRYRYVATGLGAQRWQAFKQAASRTIGSTIPEAARLAGTSEPKPGVESAFKRALDLALTPSPIESDVMLELRSGRTLERSIKEETDAMRARRR